MRTLYKSRYYMFFLTATLALLLFTSAEKSCASNVDSVVKGHNTCEQCHGRFPFSTGALKSKSKSGRPAVIPEDEIDLLCLGCHGPAGIAMSKANIHGIRNYGEEPAGCKGCHDPHDNNQNMLGRQNRMLIGQEVEHVGPNAWNEDQLNARIRTPNSGIRSVVFESRGTDVGESSIYSFADGDEDQNYLYSGICEVCHTRTKYHRNNPSGDHSHYVGQTCTNCHDHENQFLAITKKPWSGLELSGILVDDSGFAWSGVILFLDINGNGTYDDGEPIAVTDENGNFVFKGIVNKGYDVLIQPDSAPVGYDVAISSDGNVVVITTTAQPAGLEGYVWSDVNMSGLFEEDDAGLPGVTVFVDINSNGIPDTEEPTAITDEYGFYSIVDLPHEHYWVRIDQNTVSAEYQFITNNNPFSIVLDPGQVMTGVNFGFRSRFAVDPGRARLLYPARLTWTANDRYFVTDSKVNALFMYTGDGYLIGQLRGLDKPLGVAADALGRIYVGNNGRNNVEVYSAGGVKLRVIDNGNLKMPNDLALDQEQNLYVLDSQNKMVKVYNQNGQFLRRIGRAGGSDGQFTFPIAMAIQYRMENDVEVSELFVADKQSSRIQVFDLKGNYLRSFGGPVEEQVSGGMMGMFGGTTTWAWEGKFVGIQSLAFDLHGRLHALDSFQDKVQILDPVTGDYIDSYDAFIQDAGAHLQLDIDISLGGKVMMTNAATRSVENIYTVQ